MIHPQIIAPGQDGRWSGARVHDAQVERCLSTVWVPDPFIVDSSQGYMVRVGPASVCLATPTARLLSPTLQVPRRGRTPKDIAPARR
jgi:hypothetical protein